jgi:hypothetical protein
VEKVAPPAFTAPVPSAVAPSKNVTAPVATDGLTVAVSTTGAPEAKDVPVLVSVVVVPEVGGAEVTIEVAQPERRAAPDKSTIRRRDEPRFFTNLENSKQGPF